MATVFISYARADLEVAEAIQREVTFAGLACWRDVRWLNAGDDFAAEITTAIRRCDAFLLLLSPASNASKFVSKEVAIAHHFKKPIIPVSVKQAEVSDELLPYVVRLHVWSLTNGHSTSELAAALAERFGVRAPRQPAEPAARRQSCFVTCRDYAGFVQAAKRRRLSQGRQRTDEPMTNVSWDDASAYCDWAGGRLPELGDDSAVDAGGSVPSGGEWWNAGTERHKQVRHAVTAEVIAVMDRGSAAANVGFRCLAVAPPPARRFVRVGAGACELGTEMAAFGRLADLHHLADIARKPMLNRPARRYDIRAYSIAAECVTNEDFYQFVLVTGKAWPSHWAAQWLDRGDRPFPANTAAFPVVNVSGHDADAYCVWSRARLPTSLEWERAASGPKRRAYPWGDDYDAERCNSVESERGALARVDAFAPGDSAEGVRQMAGNVAEWVVGPQGDFECRGGSYQLPCELWGLVYAFRESDGAAAPDVGFRIVKQR